MQNERQEYKKIAEMIFFGYTMKYGDGLPDTMEAKIAACATQQFVWEYIQNNIDGSITAPSRDSWKSNFMSDSIYNDWLNDAETLYNDYHNNNVSFNYNTINANIGESISINDSNGVLANYQTFSKTIDGITFEHQQGSNDIQVIVPNDIEAKTITFNSSQNELFKLMPNGAEYNKETMSSYLYFQFESGDIQNLIFSNHVEPSYFEFYVNVQAGNINLYKTDSKGKALAGCVFKLYKDEACNNEISTGTSQSDGNITFDKLAPGVYYIKEVQVPAGYLIDETTQEVNVENGQTSYVTFKNNVPLGEIIINKSIALRKNVDASFVDASNLSGIQFKLTAKSKIIDNADGSIIYKANQVVGTYNLDKKGNLKISNLPMGEYELQEIKTLPGLVLDNTKYNFKFEKKDNSTKVYTQNKKIINDATLTEISKKSITGQEELEGAKLTIIDNDEKVVDSWISGKEAHKIEGLEVGKEYTLKEEIAPMGYEKATDIKFKIENTKEIKKVEMIDEVIPKEESPTEELTPIINTGSIFSNKLLITISAISIVAVIFGIILFKKKLN